MSRKKAHYDWTKWTPQWQNLLALDLKSVTTGPGAYVIATGNPLKRAVGEDELGILDIGETGALRDRFRKFIRCSGERFQKGHMAGWRYCFFCLDRVFTRAKLQVRWIETQTKQAAHAIEGEVLLAYLRNHCELPPLNYKFNWSSFGDKEYGCIDDYDAEVLAAARKAKQTAVRI